MEETLEDLAQRGKISWQRTQGGRQIVKDFFRHVLPTRTDNRFDIHGTSYGPGWKQGDRVEFFVSHAKNHCASATMLKDYIGRRHPAADPATAGHMYLTDLVF